MASTLATPPRKLARAGRLSPAPAAESIYLMNDRMELYELPSNDFYAHQAARLSPEGARVVVPPGAVSKREGSPAVDGEWTMSPDGVWYRTESGSSPLPALKGTGRGRRAPPPSATDGSFSSRLEYDQWRRQQNADALRRERAEAELAELRAAPSPSRRTQAIMAARPRGPVLERMSQWEHERTTRVLSKTQAALEREREAATFRPRLSPGTQKLAEFRSERLPARSVFKRMEIETDVRKRKLEQNRAKVLRERERDMALNCTFHPNSKPRLPAELVSVDHSCDRCELASDDEGGCDSGALSIPPSDDGDDEVDYEPYTEGNE